MAVPTHHAGPKVSKATHGVRGSYGQSESINFRAIGTGARLGLNVHNEPTGIRFGSLIVGGSDGAGRAIHSVNFRYVKL